MSENGDVRVVPVQRASVAMTSRGVQLTSMDDAWRFCEAIANTPLAPKGMDAKSIFGVVQSGAELGLTPFRALANMKIINGRVGPMGALAKAKVREANVLAPGSGFKETFTGTEFEDDFTATITTHRGGESAVLTTSFSVADAKRAGLWMKKSRDGKEGPWCQYPKRMLMWRAIGFHMDDYYGDVLLGFHIAEVLADYPDEERVVTVMTPVETPQADPLLDALDVKHTEELAVIAEELQPPTESAAELAADMADLVPDGVDPKTGEYVEGPVGQAEPKQSPLEAVMAEKTAEAPPMTEEEAMADLVRDGVISEDELEAADPSNKAEEGEEVELPL